MNGRDEMLNEAIAKAKEAEDWQLVEWLRAARGAESSARWYTEKLRDAHRAERKLMNENAKLRELVRDMWSEGMCECGSLGKCATCMYEYPTRMRELGVDA